MCNLQFSTLVVLWGRLATCGPIGNRSLYMKTPIGPCPAIVKVGRAVSPFIRTAMRQHADRPSTEPRSQRSINPHIFKSSRTVKDSVAPKSDRALLALAAGPRAPVRVQPVAGYEDVNAAGRLSPPADRFGEDLEPWGGADRGL
jgi:hypothetical protein